MMYIKYSIHTCIAIFMFLSLFQGKMGGFFDRGRSNQDTVTRITATANSGGNVLPPGADFTTGGAKASVNVSTVSGDDEMIITIETVEEPETAEVAKVIVQPQQTARRSNIRDLFVRFFKP